MSTFLNINSWAPQRFCINFQTHLTNWYIEYLLLNCPLGECQKTLIMISQQRLSWGLGAIMQQAIMLTQIYVCHVISIPADGPSHSRTHHTWLWHDMETLSMSLAICEGNPPVTCGFPSHRASDINFDDFFDVCLNKWSNKQWSCQ